MTLVTALRIENIPAVIGDFITTDARVGVKHDFTPTRPNLNDAAHPALPRTIRGLQRKLLLVNPRFIVAYAGYLNEAALVLAKLQNRFGQSADGPTLLEIDRELSPFKNRCNGKLTIIGWTVRSRPCCFKWVAGPDAHVRHVTHAIEGSGAAHFGGLATDMQAGTYSAALATALEKATLLGIGVVGAVLFNEVFSGETLKHSYGYGAELVLFNGREFKFVPGLAFCFWKVRIELNGSIILFPANILAACEPRGRYCAMQVTRLAMDDTRLKATNTYVALTSAPHDPLNDIPKTELQRVVDLSQVQYYFNAIDLFDARTSKTTTRRANDAHRR
jgi:hypothetical protein